MIVICRFFHRATDDYHRETTQNLSMVSAKTSASPTFQVPLAEKRVTLHNISWDAYEMILKVLGDKRAAKLTYHHGTLEIMTPLEEHENSSSILDDYVKILTEEEDLTLKSMQSTTLNRPELKAGAEPDQCYYLVNEPLVRGKTVDLRVDPPPDLVVEVDITHTDINKNLLYAEIGVPEFWRYDGQYLKIYLLQNGAYQEVETSPTFSWLSKQGLYQFLRDCQELGETQAKKKFRNWVRQQLQVERA